MITEERLTAYLRSLEKPKTDFLENLRRKAVSEGVPVIRLEEEALLKFFVRLKKPQRILEVGCAVGYSALLMASVMPDNCRITTIENYEPRIAEAQENFRNAGFQDRIELLQGDASGILKALEGPYDLIFMDAAKAQYIVWLPEVLRLLSDDGVLISDNVLQDGDVVESRYAVERRNRTIHGRMREYLYELKHRDDLETAVLPIGDGAAVTTKVINS